MLIPKGNVLHSNLSTAFTYIDQFVNGLQDKQFTGYCYVSFWEYDGILFFKAGKILSGRETVDNDTRFGETAVANILAKAREKDGVLNVSALPEPIVSELVATLNTISKYESLSTDLTSLDKLIALVKKETLSGYIEAVLEHDVGVANLFFAEGELIESLFAPPDNQVVAEAMTVDDIIGRCQEYGAIFNVYQSVEKALQKNEPSQGIPQKVLSLFESLLIALESTAEAVVKKGAFQPVFKKVLPDVAKRHDFLDPFLGDFRYVNQALAYTGDAKGEQFVGGLCELLNAILASLLTTVPRITLLSKLSSAMVPVVTASSDLIHQLQLEIRMPDILRDYFYTHDNDQTEEAKKVLNLQGIGVLELGADSILKEFYRVISAMTEKSVDANKSVVHYAAMKKSREFGQYQTATALLQQFELGFLKNRDERLAFWLNLYNFLVIDGILEYSLKNRVQDAKGFFAKTCYRIGEQLFSLDDIEHGILRNNQRRPYSASAQFGKTDSRKTFALAPFDARIHCCLVRGAKSSPRLVVYTPVSLDSQLHQAVSHFVSTHGVRLEKEKHELWLNRVFYWYRKDFEGQGKTLIDFIHEYLPDNEQKQFMQQNRTKLTLRFMDYDWSLNGE